MSDMRVLYLDCGAGIAGDMFLGALLDLGAPEAALQEVVDQLGIEATVTVRDERKGSLRGTGVRIESPETRKRTLDDIETILEGSSLSESVIERSKRVFRRLGTVEADIHGEDVDTVHFHELGDVDTIVDVAGTFHLLEHVDPDRVYASPVNLGRGGTIRSEHGLIPNPAPATVELLRGIPTYSEIEGEETVTPTGAVLLGEVVDVFDEYPRMEIERVGYGAGEKEFRVPNLLRILQGSSGEDAGGSAFTTDERIVQIETNLDDCNPELLANATEKLFSAGAIDVWQTPVQMKKNRSGVLLSVLCDPDDVTDVETVIFEETTSLGYRYRTLEKRGLRREVREVETAYGPVEVKFGYFGDHVNVAPEFESCRKAGEREAVSVKEVYREAHRAAARSADEN